MKRYFDLIIINVLTLIIGILFYYITNQKVEILTAFLVTGISISLGIRQYKIENDKMFKELFTDFNTKYDEKFNNQLNSIEEKAMNNSNYVLTSVEKEIIIDYLNLCAEEYLWYKKGRIDHLAWIAWENGMKHYLLINSIMECVKSETPQKDSYYGLFEKLKIER